jgi:PHD/YefM family antitoxin component YafN of YafNO toxin-antitoxin module
MMIDLHQIYPLSDFQRHTKERIAQLQESHSPAILTVNGKAVLVMQDVESYQQVIDELEQVRAALAVKKSLKEFENGQGKEAHQALIDLGEQLGVPN